jgi:hypothetical protein
MDYVLLQCKEVSGKLKVKMMSSQPFIKGFNCQFPRNIRFKDMYYVVKSSGIKLKGSFYSAMMKDIIVCQTYDIEEIKKYINTLNLEDKKIKPTTIFGDDEETECIICMSNEKNSIFSPCGHYMTCRSCANQCKNCPICRSNITCILSIDEMKND